jgi:hypothetical protein
MNKIGDIIIQTSIYCSLGLLFLNLLPIDIIPWSDGCISVINRTFNIPVYTNCPVFTQQN